MPDWEIETLDHRVDREIEELTLPLCAALARISALIKAVGLERIREPYLKHVEGPIWEMRPSTRGLDARAFYVTRVGRRVIILRVFEKKSQATPRRELELARQRLKELNERLLPR